MKMIEMYSEYRGKITSHKYVQQQKGVILDFDWPIFIKVEGICP